MSNPSIARLRRMTCADADDADVMVASQYLACGLSSVTYNVELTIIFIYTPDSNNGRYTFLRKVLYN